jgi:hypothetical protein
MWNTALTTPLEKGNKLNYFHVDQGLVIGRIGKIEVEPYVALNATKDTKGYQWNNRVEGEVGLKLVRPFRNGLVIFGGAYAGEWRAHVNGVRSQTKYAPIGYFSDWFGWKQPTANSSKGRKMFRSFPGTTWFTVGNISPYERNNVIGLGRLEQGVTLLRLGRVSVIPQGTFQMGFDTDKNAWNNRYTYGGGVKIAIPWRTAAFDVQGGYECAQQYRGLGSNGPSVCGPIVRINLWTGWRKKVGGQ